MPSELLKQGLPRPPFGLPLSFSSFPPSLVSSLPSPCDAREEKEEERVKRGRRKNDCLTQAQIMSLVGLAASQPAEEEAGSLSVRSVGWPYGNHLDRRGVESMEQDRHSALS